MQPVFFYAQKSADCLPKVSALQTTPHGQGITIIHVRKLQSGAAFVAFCETEEGLLEAEGETAAEAKSLLLSML